MSHGASGIRWKTTTTLDDLNFADDVALLSSTKEQIHWGKIARLQEQAGTMELKINRPNTKIMKINAENHRKINVDGQVVRDIDEFMYLGATIRKEKGGMKELKNTILKSRSKFVHVKISWRSSYVSTRLKLQLNKTLVLPVLLYACMGAKRVKRMMETTKQKNI